jgi:hypothetical protein
MTPDEIVTLWKGSEDGHQAALFAWAGMAAKYGWNAARDNRCYRDIALASAMPGHGEVIPVELSLMFAIANGGQRHKAVAAKLKATGVKSGVLDVCLPVARGGYHGLFIEMKKPKKGVVSANQKFWALNLARQGFRVEFCYDWHKAAHILRCYLEDKTM